MVRISMLESYIEKPQVLLDLIHSFDLQMLLAVELFACNETLLESSRRKRDTEANGWEGRDANQVKKIRLR